MPRGRRKKDATVAADADAPEAEAQGDSQAAADGEGEEAVAAAELETIGSRLRSLRTQQRGPTKVLLYDGDLIAYADPPEYVNKTCDPEVGYHLVEVLGTIEVELDGEEDDGTSTAGLIKSTPYFNEEIGLRGCLWMPLGMSQYYLRTNTKWTVVRATTGLKDDRIRTTWAEHKRIQRELGVQGQVQLEDDDDDVATSADDVATSADESGDDASVTPPPSASVPRQRIRKRSSAAAASAADSGDDDRSEEEQPAAKKARPGHQASTSSPGKARQPRTPKQPKAPKFKKGFAAPHPDLAILDSDPIFTGTEPVKGGKTLHSSDVLRAVKNNDMDLLRKTIDDTQNVHFLLYGRSVADHEDAMTLAAKNGNVEILATLCKHINDPMKPERASPPRSSLQHIGSGSVGIATFGHRVGPVGAARGGRELHNAMLAQVVCHRMHGAPVLSAALLQHCTDTSAIERIQALFNMQVMGNLYLAVRAGNRAVAHHFAKKMVSDGGWDFNKLHEQALRADGSDFEPFREVSVTKKGGHMNHNITPVHMAAINPDTKYLQALLASHGDSSVSDTDNWRIAHYAAACTGAGPLRVLADRGTDLLCLTKQKQSPLMIAAELGRLDNVKLLLEDKANVPLLMKQKDRLSNTALHLAAKNGHVDVVDTLIEAGGKETICNNEHMTPMGVAAAFGHLHVIRTMKERGFSLAKPDRRQRTPLVLASRDGQVHVARYLLHFGVDANFPDSSGNAPAHYAAAYGWLHVLKLLIEEGGADPDATTSWKATPLSCAALSHEAECVEYLVHLDRVNLNVVDACGRTIAANLCLVPSHSALKQLSLLIERGADISIADAGGSTPLHQLCASNSASPPESRELLVEKFARLLLDSGADPEKANNDGCTPLLAALTGSGGDSNLYAAGFLIHTGVSVVAVDRKGRNPLHHAAKKLAQEGASSFLSALLKHKDVSKLVNTYDASGATPLLVALQGMKELTKPKSWYWNKEDDEKKLVLFGTNIKKMLGCAVLDVNLPIRKTKMKGEDNKKFGVDEPMDEDSDNEDEEDSDSYDDDDDEDGSDEDPASLSRGSSKEKKGLAVRADGELPFELVDEDRDAVFDAPESTNMGFTAVHLAIHENPEFLPILNTILKRPGVNMDIQGVGGTTALHLAVSVSTPSAESLLKANANVNVQDAEGRTVLHLMMSTLRDTPIFKKVFGKTNLLLQDCRGRTVLHLAAIEGDCKLAEKFIDTGCPVGTTDRLGRIALHYAVATGARSSDASSDFEAMLLQRGSDVNARDVFERTPVHYAFLPALFSKPQDCANRGHSYVPSLESVKKATKKNEEDDRRKFDPIETVYCLFSVAKGALVDPLDESGRSPLHYAAKVSALTSSLHMLAAGANINRKDTVNGDMPLRVALTYDNPEYAIMVMQKGAEATPGVVSHSKDAFCIEVKISSVFYIAVQKGWLGVSYMIFDSEFPLFDGLRDAMLTQKYTLTATLMKKVDRAKLKAVDDEKRTLLHWLCISADSETGANARDVVEILLKAGCSASGVDQYGRTPLHYASQKAAAILVTELQLKVEGIDLNIVDADGKSALVLAVEGSRRRVDGKKRKLEAAEMAVATILAREFFASDAASKAPVWEKANVVAPLLLKNGADYDVTYRDPSYSDGATTLLIHAVRQGSTELFNSLLGAAASNEDKARLCQVCDEQGLSPLAHAIILNEMRFAGTLLPHSDMKFKTPDGRTLAHLVVKPVAYGSYDNVELLQLLAKRDAPLDEDDDAGHSPMHYAKLQDSGRMAATLRKLGAGAPVPGLSRDRTVWKKFVEKPYNVDEDCLAYIADAATKEKPKPEPDRFFEKRSTSTVYADDGDVLYDVLLNKVDISHGAFGYNNYYRMQVLHETVQGAYYLWTHWGRWGDSTGMFQRTPFNTPKEACTEFCKIFRSKTGNDFLQSAAGQFTQQPKKYALMTVDRSHATVSSLLVPFDLDDAVPASKLDESLQSTMKYLTRLTVLRDRARVHGLSSDGVERVLMFGEASSEKLFQARSVLMELHPLVKSYSQMRYQPNCDVDKLLEANKRIVTLSQKYYETVPFAHTAFGGTGSSPMEVMSDESMLRSAMTQLEKLSDLSLTARVLLAAWHRYKAVNPLDYVFKSMEASMVPLQPDDLERQVIEAYMITTGEDCIKQTSLSAVYKVERRGEPQRMEQYRSWANHRLLWHGSPQVNVIGILSQGLLLTRGNPAQRHFGNNDTEESIWNGLYFADMFAKSFGYAHGHGGFGRRPGSEDSKKRIYMFLCEVVLGKMETLKYNQFRGAKGLPAGRDCMYCPGKRAPNWKNAVVLPNGVEIPLGEVAHPGRSLDSDNAGRTKDSAQLFPMAEYIMPDESRVRIRYVLELELKKNA